MKLYFLRHAQRGHGEHQDTLTKDGIEQANKLVSHLCKLKVDKVICGALNRTRKTIEPTIATLNIPVEFTDEVNERSLGVLQGKPKELKDALIKSGLTLEEFKPVSGEDALDAYNRAKRFVEQLKKQKEQSILIVSHSGFISDVATILLKKPMEENRNYKSGFCALTYFELDEEFNVIDYKIDQKTVTQQQFS